MSVNLFLWLMLQVARKSKFGRLVTVFSLCGADGCTDFDECSFEDINDLGAGVAKCRNHDKMCPVPKYAFICKVGFVCENLSKAFNGKVTNGESWGLGWFCSQ